MDMQRSSLRQAAVPFQWLRVLFALIVREMSTKFGRSWGGYVWAVADPLGGIVLLTIAFSMAFRTPPIGTNFALFYATGIIPLFLFNGISNSVSAAISSNRGLLRYPVVTPLDTVFSKFFLELATMLVVAVLLYSGIVMVYDLNVNLDMRPVLAGFALTALVGLGVGTLNCVLIGFFPTWRNIWSILTKPLFIVSGIFFTFESVPREIQAILWYNPLIHSVGAVRSGFYPTYEPFYVSYGYMSIVGLVPFLVGALLMRRHASWLIEN